MSMFLLLIYLLFILYNIMYEIHINTQYILYNINTFQIFII